MSDLIDRQPEKRTIERTETHACDCISRQAAIDAIDEINAEVEDGYGFDYAKWRVHFRVLPSAQPEIVRCKDCVWRDGSICRNNDTMPWSDDDFCSLAERRTDDSISD